MRNRKFTVINEEFSCHNCGKNVPKALRTCRNHCPFCLFSRHVDINPGDRANSCQGLMKPVGYEISGKKGVRIVFECLRCQQKTKNIAMLDDGGCPDNYEALLRL